MSASPVISLNLIENNESASVYIFKPSVKANNVSKSINNTFHKLKAMSFLENIFSVDDRGCSSIISGSFESTPKAMAGNVSVTKLTHKMCTAVNGAGHPIKIPINNAISSPKLQDSKNKIDFLIFL